MTSTISATSAYSISESLETSRDEATPDLRHVLTPRSSSSNESGGTVLVESGETTFHSGASEPAAVGAHISHRVKALTPPVPPRERFVALSLWEGVVEAVDDEVFRARLVDLKGGLPDFDAEIHLAEVAPSDRQRVVRGAVFYWSIGYLDTASGQRKRESTITFRSLPAWTRKDVDEARRRAKEIADEIGWR